MKTNQRVGIGTTIFAGFLFLIWASPSAAIDLLTQRYYFPGGNVSLEYTYYLDTTGQQVLHGTRTQYYAPLEVSVIQQYSHGKLHGLEEAWYQDSYTYGHVKHWEKEYQDGQLHGYSRYWYQETGGLRSYETYRYGKLHGPSTMYSSGNAYDNRTMEANYQDGLLHGHYKSWIVNNYGGYYNPNWQQRVSEEGDYAYGKKNGYWQTWYTSQGYPILKDEGSYGNGAKCGTWRYYYESTGGLQKQETLAACQNAAAPGAGPPLPPGGNKYEIRGHITNRDTNQPIEGVAIAAGGDGGGTSGTDGFYSIVLDNSGTYTLDAQKDGYYTFSRTVSLANTQYLNVDIAMKPVEEGGKPVITNVDPKGGTFFIQGIAGLSSPNQNEYVVSVNWNGGQPRKVRFEVNGTSYEENASSSGASHTFDMNADFQGSLSPTGNTLKITAVNGAGLESRPETLNPIVIPLPSWSLKMGEEFEIKQDGSHLVYTLDTAWPEEPITIIVSESYIGSTLWTLWGLVPYIGGRNFGIPDTQAFLTIEAKTDGTGSIAAGGQSGFEAAGGEIGIKLGGKGNLKYEPNVGLQWKETSLILGIEGKIEKTVGPVTLIPALEGAVNLPLIGRAIGWFNEKAEITGSITTNAETTLEIMSATGEIGFNKADIETGVGIELGMAVDLIEGLEAGVTGGGSGKLLWQVPAAPDYFKQLETELSGNITLKFLDFEWTEEFTYPYTYPEEATPGSIRRALSIPELKPISRAFLNYGPYNVPLQQQGGTRRTMDTGGAGANSEMRIVQNVFPYSEPAIAALSAGARTPTAIAYVYLDPAKPVHQETDIYFTILTSYTADGGISYYYEASTPAPIKSDFRAEFAPTLAYDANGKIVCVWQRVKNTNFPSSGSIADMAADLEIVYAVYNGTTWSEPVPLTDNAYMDYNPVLKRGANGDLMLVWFSNEGNLLVGSDAYPTTVHYALWNKTSVSFSTPTTLPQTFANCFKFSFAYRSSGSPVSAEATLAYIKDMDGSLATVNDQEIFYTTFNGTTWSAPVQVTNDLMPDANPKVAYRNNGTVELVWLKGDALVRRTAVSPLAVETIRQNVRAADSIDFSLYTDTNGKLVLLWQNSDEKGIDLFYSVFDGAAWSSVLRLTEGPAIEKNVQGVFGWPNLYHLVFNRKDRSTGITDLYHKTFKLVADLAVAASDLSVLPANPAPGDTVTLKCRVTNRGDLAVANPVVKFYLGNPAVAGYTLLGMVNLTPATLKAGEVGQAELAWTIPTGITQYKIYAVVSATGVTEANTANNTASFDVIKPDLKAVRCILERRPDGTKAIRAEIRNDSQWRSADNVVVLFKAQDTPIGTMTIPGILPGKSAEVVLAATLDIYSYTSLEPRISVTADPDNLIQEIDEGNNTASFIHTLEAVSPAIQDFGLVHYSGAMGSVAVFNKTTTGLAIGAISLAGGDAGDFRIFDNTLTGTTISSQQSALLGLEFIPTSLGVKNAVLLIRDNQGKVLWQVPLTGQLDYLIRGDLNDDGAVTLADAILGLKAVSGLRPAGIFPAVDVNADGKIGLAEVIYILQKTAELRN